MQPPTAPPAGAPRRPPRLAAALALLLLGGCAGAAAPASAPAPAAAPAPEAFRILDFEGNPVGGIAELAEALQGADVVFVGEQHTDAVAHRLELELLRALGAGERPVTVALEMFERDVQESLDAYLAGRLSEAEFLEASRPWPNYADYRPLVEMARERGWPVVASNVPRPFAASVAREGLAALDALPPEQRAWAAEDIRCPEDDYFRRFDAEMRGHAGAHGSGDGEAMTAMIRRLYEAQCIKDETMAESIAAITRGGGSRVIHFNGAFHSDAGLGIVPRLQRRRGRLEIAIVSMIPVADVRDPAAAERFEGTADFVVLTRASETGNP